MSIRIFPNKQPDVKFGVDIYVQLGWGTLKDYNMQLWQRAYERSDFISAYDDGQLVGFVRLLSDGFHDTQVLEFVIAPAYQNKGVGTQLLDALKDNWGHTDIYCNTVNKSLDFFLNNGFKRNRLEGVSCARTK